MAQGKVYDNVQRPWSADKIANLISVPAPEMTTGELVTHVIKPATKGTQRRYAELSGMLESVWAPDNGLQPFAFISHAFGNPFRLVIDAVLEKYGAENAETTFVWIDIFASAFLFQNRVELLPCRLSACSSAGAAGRPPRTAAFG